MSKLKTKRTDVKFNKEFLEAISKKLEDISFPLGYLSSSHHPNVQDLAKELPVNGATLLRILNNSNQLASDRSIFKVMKWIGLKTVNLSYSTNFGSKQETLILK